MALTYSEMVKKAKAAPAVKTTSIGLYDAMKDPSIDKAAVIAQLPTSKANPIIGKTVTAADLKKTTPAPKLRL